MAKRNTADPYKMPEYDPEVTEWTLNRGKGRPGVMKDIGGFRAPVPPDADMEVRPEELRGMGAPYPMFREMADGGEVDDAPPQQELRAYKPTWRDNLARFFMGEGSPSPARRNFVEGLTGSTGIGPTQRNGGMSLVDFTPAGPFIAAQEAMQGGNYRDAALNAVPGAGAAKAMFLGPFGALMARNLERETGRAAAVHPIIGQEVKDKTAHINPKLRDAVRGWDVDRRDALAQYNLSRPADDYRDRLTFSESGWSRGADNLPRKEVVDTGTKIVHVPDQQIANTWKVEHPSADLHKIYDMPPVQFDWKQPTGDASFDAISRQIRLGGDSSKTGLKKSVGPSLHEIQHGVQNAEGFSGGSNPHLEIETPKFQEHTGGQRDEAANNMLHMWIDAGLHNISPQTRAAIKDYMRRSGEVEARNTEARRAKSYRYLLYPSDTEDIPRSQQLTGNALSELYPDIQEELKKRASGGKVTDWYKAKMKANKSPAAITPTGMLKSTIPGRTDKLQMKVQPGSYVIPADIPSALGQGNTMAGSDILDKMLKKGPYGMNVPKSKAGMSTRMTRKATLSTMFADGGDVEPAEIIAAGGEFLVSPDDVRHVGNGDIDAGHQILDEFVKMVRKQHIKTLKSLPGPKQS